MGTKNQPGKFDCYENAEPDEPMFVLLARDPLAPNIVRTWVEHRQKYKQFTRPDDKANEALDCAEAMEKWRLEKYRAKNG